MSNLVKFWNTVVKAIDDNVEELREVRPYAGEFESKEKGRVSIKTPGALVAVTGNDVATKLPDGRLSLHISVAVAIICEDRRREVDTVAADIAERIVTLIHQNRFRDAEGNVTARSDPDGISLMNYNSDATLGQGISVWGVGWEQAIIIGVAGQADPINKPVPEVGVHPATGGFKPAEPSGDDLP